MRRTEIRNCLGIGFVGLAMLPALATSQVSVPRQGGVYVSGVVRDVDSHQPVSAVNLDLQRSSGETASPTVVSGTRGEYQFTGIISGDYYIQAHLKGYEPASVSIMVGGVPLMNVTIDVHRSPGSSSAVAGDAISAHQLSIPENARDAFDKGFKLLNGPKPDYKKALSFFERAIKSYPDYYEAYAEAGVAQHRLGDKASAEQDLRKSVELSAGKYTDALMWLSEMLNDDGRFNDAEDFSRRCATQDDSSWRCDLELARALAGLKHAVDAEAVATKASELNPNNPGTFLVLGNIHIQEHKFAAVVKDFDTYLKLDPAGPQSDQVRAAQAQARQALAKTQNQAASPQPQ